MKLTAQEIRANAIKEARATYVVLVMEEFHEIIADGSVGLAMSWMDDNGMADCYAHLTGEDEPLHTNQLIIETFHHAYNTWAIQEARVTSDEVVDQIFPKTKMGARRFASWVVNEAN